MTRVAFVTTDLRADNGWGRYSREIIQRLPAHGIEPVVLMTVDAPADPLGVASVLRSYHDGWAKPMHLMGDRLRAAGLLAGCQAVHCLAEPLMVAAHAMAGQRRLFITAVGTYAVSTIAGRWGRLYRRAYASTEAIPAISRYTASRLAEAAPDLASKLRVIPLGVDCPVGETPPATARDQAFLMVGQVKPRKGMLQAVEALAIVRTRCPEARLLIAGAWEEDAYVRRVRARIHELGQEHHVSWLGRIDEPELIALYRRVRGLVMPSLNAGAAFEGFGLVHLEANTHGVPAIGSRGCGNEDAISDGRSGFLIDQGDEAGLASAMIRLVDPAYDWDALSASALAFARDMSWERVAAAYAALYRAREEAS